MNLLSHDDIINELSRPVVGLATIAGLTLVSLLALVFVANLAVTSGAAATAWNAGHLLAQSAPNFLLIP